MAPEKFTDEFFRTVLARETRETEYERHPTFQTLVDFVHKELESQDLSIVSAHISTCSECSARVERIRNELQQISQSLESVLPDPTRYLSRRSFLQRVRRLLFGTVAEEGQREAPRTEHRLPGVGWGRAWAVAATAALVLMLGTLSWLNFEVGRLRQEIATVRQANTTEIATLQEKIAALTEALGASQATLAALSEQVSASSAALSELSEQIAMQPPDVVLEGAAEEALIEVTVNKDLTGFLRIYERVQGKVLFEGIVRAGSTLRFFGQRLEISWRIEDGKDAITVKGWEKVKHTEEAFQALSEGQFIEEIQQKDGQYVIRFP